jgi:hypothetical protein
MLVNNPKVIITHVERMSEERSVRKVFKNNQEGERTFGKPKKRWLDDVQNGLKKICVRGWNKIAVETL